MLPIVSGKFKISEPVMLSAILTLESSSYLCSAFVPELWQFYLSYAVMGFMTFCKYSLTMSLLSKVRNRIQQFI